MWTQAVTTNDDGKIEIASTDTDRLRYGRQPKTMTCTDCKTRVPNPDYEK